jgi:putative two-component system response regulator
MGKQIAYFHHEHWDGTGYPNGLKGKEIPLSARIVAIADVYDALTSDRPYKKAFSHEDAVAIIQKEREKHFDPDIVDAFIQNHEAFKRIKLFVELEEHPENITNILEERKREIVQS